MAPEQVEKPRTVDHRADIYSLGVVFYEMLTGELPLGKFAPPSHKVQIDVRLDDVVLRALEKEPQRRYQQVSQVKTDMVNIARTEAQSAGSPALRTTPLAHFPRRLRDRWLWDPNIIWMSLLVPTVLVGILVLALVPFWGLKALYLGLLETFAFLYAGIYGWIYSRMRRLWERLPLGAVETVEVLIAQQTLQTPGLAVLTQDRLELIGLTGAPLTIPLKEIVGARETRWFNGRRLWWKMGLVLERANARRRPRRQPQPNRSVRRRTRPKPLRRLEVWRRRLPRWPPHRTKQRATPHAFGPPENRGRSCSRPFAFSSALSYRATKRWQRTLPNQTLRLRC
jgi:hypothetical protein